jgi:hypothetical protein
MRTSFDIVLLLFTTCLVTGFKQFSSFFQNSYTIQTTLQQANAENDKEKKVIQWAKQVFQLMMSQYVLILIWLAISLYLEINLGRRAQLDTMSKPVQFLKVYTAFSIGLLVFLIVSTIYIRVWWTGKLIRPLEAGKLPYSQGLLDFIRTMDSLLDINYVFSIGIDIFIVFIIIQLWKEKTINEYRIKLEGSNTIDITSLDGKSLQKYHFGSGSAFPQNTKCLFSSSSSKRMSLSEEIACLLA